MTQRQWIVFAFALAAGGFLAYQDRPTDDTGIIAGLLFTASLALSIYAPDREIVVALLVGGPLVLAGIIGGNASIVIALGFALAGAMAARYGRRVFSEAFPAKG